MDPRGYPSLDQRKCQVMLGTALAEQFSPMAPFQVSEARLGQLAYGQRRLLPGSQPGSRQHMGEFPQEPGGRESSEKGQQETSALRT